ncbi:MAG: sigma-54 dependent transcriptional regulator [Spirochaetales bacterium]|nr:sigma-54 dependent transcriptional regulator [Spirochaetales bacterium]
MKKHILIIDDNEKLCRSLCRNFEQLGYKKAYVCNTADAQDYLKNTPPDTVLLDIALGDESGLDLLKYIREEHPALPVIMITGYGTIETAIESIKSGAFDYIQKPLEFNKLLVIVENALRMKQLKEENTGLKSRIFRMAPKMITGDPGFIQLCEKAERLADTDFPILIQGESGTGKEGMAEFIHNRSGRNAAELVKINCAAFPENLLDNELFGHEKGAYTGADDRFKGVFEKADGGTLLMDEIGDMTLATQAKILRTIQNSEIRRIGGDRTIHIDVRFIASTNKDLKELIRKGQFREDLYYRLSTATIQLPPLRDRKGDIPLLADSFLSEYYGKENHRKSFSPRFSDVLNQYDWPGNIRELKNIINYAAALAVKENIDLEDLPPSFLQETAETRSESLLESSEKELILKTLRKTNNNKKKTAEILNLSRKTLYNKLAKYEI